MPGSRSSEPVDRITTRGRGPRPDRGRGRRWPAGRGGAGRARCPSSISRSPSVTSSPARRTCWPSRRRLGDPDLGDAAVGPLVGHDRVGAGRHRRAGHDLDRGAGRHREQLGLAGADLADHRQVHRGVLGGAGDVGVRGRRTRPSRSCRRTAGRSARRRPRRRQAEGLHQRLREAGSGSIASRIRSRCSSTGTRLVSHP